MFAMGPAYGLKYYVAPENAAGEFEVYSVIFRDYLDGNGFMTYRNSCGFFSTREAAERAKKILEESS